MSPPKGSTIVDDPRVCTDLIRALLQNLLSSLVAFGHYCSLTQDENKLQVASQVIAFVFFPALPTVQFVYNAISLALIDDEDRIELQGLPNSENDLETHYNQPGTTRYIISTICGAHTTSRARASMSLLYADRTQLKVSRSDQKRDPRWIARLFLLLVQMFANLTSFIIYVKRLQITWGPGRYVGTLKIDHRFGWWNAGSIVVTLLGTVLHVQGGTWKLLIVPSIITQRDITRRSRERLLFEIVLASLVQDWLLGKIGISAWWLFRRGMSYARFISRPVALCLIFTVWRLRRRLRAIRAIQVQVQYGLCGAFIITVAGIQLWQDIAEVIHLTQGIYSSSNYRYAVKIHFLEWWQV